MSEVLHAPNLKLEPHELQLASLLPDHFWLTTSGTTRAGRRWIALSKAALETSARAVNMHLKSDARDVWLRAIPDFHVGGLGVLERARLSGAQVFELRQWSATAFAESAAQAEVTLSALVPTQIFDLVNQGLRAPPGLRAIIVGGGALMPSLYRRARELGWPLLPSFGMTECASQIATASLESLSRNEFPTLEVLPHVEAALSSGGILRVKSDALFTAWAEWNGHAWQLQDPKSDGWFQSEDLAEIEGRNLKPLGRLGDQLKVLGELVNLSKLEARLQELVLREQGVRATLLATPHARREHSLDLVVVRASIEQAERLQACFNEGLPNFERSRGLYVVDQIPTTDLGKVARLKLLNQLGL